MSYQGHCIARIWRAHSYKHVLCGKPAKYGEFCGIHSPEKIAERAKNRGPTIFEKDMARAKDRRECEKAMKAVIKEARRITSDMWSHDTNDLKDAIKAYDKLLNR